MTEMYTNSTVAVQVVIYVVNQFTSRLARAFQFNILNKIVRN